MRILLVEPDFEDNGAIRVSLDRARRWVHKGAEVNLLIVSGHGVTAPVALPGCLRPVVASTGLRRALWTLPSVVAHGLPLARRSDVVVGGREIASGLLIGTLLAQLARKPLAVTVHSDVEAALTEYGTLRHRGNVLACIRRAGLVAPVSSGLVPGLLALGVPAKRVEIVRNGIDAARLRSLAAERPELLLPPGSVVVGLGRLSREKGFDLLIEAHALALRNGARHHRLLLMGAGPEHDNLVQLAAMLGVADSVVFGGFVDNPYPNLARADLFVLASRWEGFSLALAEAISLGVPAIACDCIAGPGEILAEGRYGRLVPVEDVHALAAAIGDHLHDPQPLRRASKAGATFVEENFDAEAAATGHLDALERLGQLSRMPLPSRQA
jgi:glycosyltransferase involved in cell wall biosynthesis